ncbi:MAG: hypothetical protein ACRD6W_07950 [Nitrososphaerales archaeon]
MRKSRLRRERPRIISAALKCSSDALMAEFQSTTVRGSAAKTLATDWKGESKRRHSYHMTGAILSLGKLYHRCSDAMGRMMSCPNAAHDVSPDARALSCSSAQRRVRGACGRAATRLL